MTPPSVRGPLELRAARLPLWAGGILIVALGAWLRVWGMAYGLPHPTARPDEELVIGKAFAIFTTGRLDPGSYTYPSLLIYLEALAIGAVARVGAWTGLYPASRDFLFAIAVSQPRLLYLVCRSVSVVLGLATIPATGLLGYRTSGRADVGLVSSLVVATHYLHVRDSRFATVDVGMTFFITLALLFAVRAVKTERWADYALAGLFSGLAASAKYNAALVVLGAVAAALAGWKAGETRRRAFWVLVAGAAMVAAFAVTSPYVLLRLPVVLAELSARRRYMYGGSGEGALLTHLRETFPVGFGWPLFLASAAAVLRSARLRRPPDLVLLAYLVPMLFSMLTTSRVFPRYLIPVVPPLAVVGAELCLDLLPRSPVAWPFVAALLAGPGLYHSIAFDRLAAKTDTRVLAADWVRQNLPPRSAVAVCKGYAAPDVNKDPRRGPAFDVLEVDCAQEGAPTGRARYLVAAEHPFLSRWSRVGRSLKKRLEAGGERLAIVTPFRSGSDETPYFYPGDAFYLPFSGLSAVERGGPIVTVWDISRLGAESP